MWEEELRGVERKLEKHRHNWKSQNATTELSAMSGNTLLCHTQPGDSGNISRVREPMHWLFKWVWKFKQGGECDEKIPGKEKTRAAAWRQCGWQTTPRWFSPSLSPSPILPFSSFSPSSLLISLSTLYFPDSTAWIQEPAHRRPCTSILHCCYFEILNNFLTWDLKLFLHAGTCKLLR